MQSGTSGPPSSTGPFYVDNTCCTSCGVPQVVAPDLVGWTDGSHPQCYWKKQPQTQDELLHAFAIFDGQELGCHRYAGEDPDIQRRIGAENCDSPIAELKQQVPRLSDTLLKLSFLRRLRKRRSERRS